MNIAEFGKTLKQLRGELGLSGDALAELIYERSEGTINITKSSISRHENAKQQSVQRDLFLVLADIL